jgi:hypothetical protein
MYCSVVSEMCVAVNVALTDGIFSSLTFKAVYTLLFN